MKIIKKAFLVRFFNQFMCIMEAYKIIIFVYFFKTIKIKIILKKGKKRARKLNYLALALV